MAEYIENVTLGTSKLDWAFPFQRTGAFPLDRSSVFSSYEDAVLYATGGADVRGLSGSSYAGQPISVYNAETDTITLYIIEADRTLKEVGSTPLGDNASIEIVNGAIQLKNFGTGYYKYTPSSTDEGGNTIPSSYTYVEGFKEGLEARVVAKEIDGATVYEINWFEPNSESVDGLADEINILKGQVEKKADKTSVYTKTEVDNLIASSEHLKRKKVNSLLDIDVTADDAEQYIYMVLVDTNVDGHDMYDEYMVMDGNLEKVGSWEINLDDYVTKTALNTTLEDYSTTEEVNTALDKKVDKKDGHSLVADNEIDKLKTVKENAEPNFIKTVSNDFSVSEAGHLTLNTLSIEKVADLQTELDSKVNKQTSLFEGVETDWILLSPENQKKLASLVIGEGGNVEVSGKVNADNVEGLASWITTNRNVVDGLYPLIDQEKLAGIEEGAEVNYVKSVKENQLSVDENGQLSITSISVGIIEDLDTIKAPFTAVSNDFAITEVEGEKTLTLTKQYLETSIYYAEVGDLEQLQRLVDKEDGSKSTIVDEINYINERLQWQELN